MTVQSWRARAVCRPGSGINPDLFFPDPTDRDTRRRAAAICHTCPVEDDCLDAADHTGERYGIWGGLTRDIHTGESSRMGPGPAKAVSTPDPRCGTESGYAAHRRRNETPCDACINANNEASNRRRGYR